MGWSTETLASGGRPMPCPGGIGPRGHHQPGGSTALSKPAWTRPELHAWLWEEQEASRRVFEPRIRELVAGEFSPRADVALSSTAMSRIVRAPGPTLGREPGEAFTPGAASARPWSSPSPGSR
jgi:hypothetical protein